MTTGPQQESESLTTFCLGVGCMTKCDTCQHEANWQVLNQLPDALRLSIQAQATRLDNGLCQITSGCFYQPTGAKS